MRLGADMSWERYDGRKPYAAVLAFACFLYALSGFFSCTAFRLAVRQELFAGEAPDMRADGISIMAAYEGSAAE